MKADYDFSEEEYKEDIQSKIVDLDEALKLAREQLEFDKRLRDAYKTRFEVSMKKFNKIRPVWEYETDPEYLAAEKILIQCQFDAKLGELDAGLLRSEFAIEDIIAEQKQLQTLLNGGKDD